MTSVTAEVEWAAFGEDLTDLEHTCQPCLMTPKIVPVIFVSQVLLH